MSLLMRPRLTSIGFKASIVTPITRPRQSFATTAKISTTLEPPSISKTTEMEKEITHNDGLVNGGPTAQAQKHVGETLSSHTISEIAHTEGKISGNEKQFPGGPAATAQSMATNGPSNTHTATNGTNGEPHIGKLDSSTIPKTTAAEKNISGKEPPLQGGSDDTTSKPLHDITESEKMITGGEKVKGSPTGTAQRELGKSRD